MTPNLGRALLLYQQSRYELAEAELRQALAVDLMGGDGWSGLAVDTVRSRGVYAGVPFTAEDQRPEARFTRPKRSNELGRTLVDPALKLRF